VISERGKKKRCSLRKYNLNGMGKNKGLERGIRVPAKREKGTTTTLVRGGEAFYTWGKKGKPGGWGRGLGGKKK